MVIFHSYVSLPEGIHTYLWFFGLCYMPSCLCLTWLSCFLCLPPFESSARGHCDHSIPPITGWKSLEDHPRDHATAGLSWPEHPLQSTRKPWIFRIFRWFFRVFFCKDYGQSCHTFHDFPEIFQDVPFPFRKTSSCLCNLRQARRMSWLRRGEVFVCLRMRWAMNQIAWLIGYPPRDLYPLVI